MLWWTWCTGVSTVSCLMFLWVDAQVLYCVAGSYGSSIYSFLRNLHTAFHSGCTNMHSHQQYISVSVLPHLGQHLLLLLPLIMDILTGVRWNLSVVLICISFIAREIELFYMYLLAICTSSFEIPCLIHVPMSSFGVLILWGLTFFSSLNILDFSPLPDE
jgi:hypothetical protein